MTTEARPLTRTEYDEQILVPANELDMLAPLSRDDVERDVRPLNQKTDRVVMYHPSKRNYSSIYLVPMNPQERRFAVNRLLSQERMVDGRMQRWNYATPQFPPTELPLRCFVAGCERRGGFSSRADLIAHVNGKHGNEAPMYQRILEALMQQVYMDIPAEQYEALGIAPPTAEDAIEMERPQARRGRPRRED